MSSESQAVEMQQPTTVNVQYVKNPKTGKQVKVGSTTYKRMMKEQAKAEQMQQTSCTQDVVVEEELPMFCADSPRDDDQDKTADKLVEILMAELGKQGLAIKAK